jgi:hypothetical protein
MTWTRLHDACQHHNNKMIVKLARCFAEEAVMVDDHGSTPLHIACWGNPPMEVVQALLQACPQVATYKDVHGNTPLQARRLRELFWMYTLQQPRLRIKKVSLLCIWLVALLQRTSLSSHF